MQGEILGVRMSKFDLVECRRGCGKKLHTLKRSLWGIPDEIKSKYHHICHDCMTQKEREELLMSMGNFAANHLRMQYNKNS